MLEITRIRINDTQELPIRCDLYVLDMIQQKYGSIEEFEKKLIGIREEDGREYRCEPSVEAVASALSLMAIEGMDIEKELNGRDYDVKTVKHLMACTTRNYRELAMELHEEFRRCFQTKKEKPSRTKKKMKVKKLISTILHS